MTTHRGTARAATPHSGSMPPPGVDTRPDRHGEAAQLTATSPGWLVLWGAYGRTFKRFRRRASGAGRNRSAALPFGRLREITSLNTAWSVTKPRNAFGRYGRLIRLAAGV